MSTVTISGGAYGYLKIDAQGRSFPHSIEYWDINSLTTPIAFHIGEFQGVIPASLMNYELRRFRTELATLYETLEGDAQLYSLEGWIGLKFHGDGLGHVDVRGSLKDEAGTGNELTFELVMDQTFLPTILSELDDVDAEFPVVGEPPGVR
jgi:hypothetical protein